VHHGEDCGEGDQGRSADVHLVDQLSHIEHRGREPEEDNDEEQPPFVTDPDGRGEEGGDGDDHRDQPGSVRVIRLASESSFPPTAHAAC